MGVRGDKVRGVRGDRVRGDRVTQGNEEREEVSEA